MPYCRKTRHVAPAHLAVVLGSVLALSVTNAKGAESSDVAKGHALAQANCARCHVVTASGKAGWTNAPSFGSIANRPTTTMASLEQVVEQPHMKMVNLPRSPAEARQIAAYIMSLRQK